MGNSVRIFNKKLIQMIFLGMLIILSLRMSKESELISEHEMRISKDLVSNYTTFGPILIENDGNFSDYGFPGMGSSGDPYRIEGYNITDSGTYGIQIKNTTKYFAIRNCFLKLNSIGIYIIDNANGTGIIANNNFSYNSYNGLVLVNTTGVKVANNSITSYQAGIKILRAANNTVINNTCNNNRHALILDRSPGCKIINNTFNNNIYGIYFRFSPKTTLINNSCSNNDDYGIVLKYCPSSYLSGNKCNNNDDGITLEFSQNSTVVNNTFSNNGLFVKEDFAQDYENYSIEDNRVNNKPLGYFVNLVGATFLEAAFGQLILIQCLNVQIANQNLSNAEHGLYLRWCDYSTIYDNFCNNNNQGRGIFLEDSSDCTLTNNTCNKNYNGIVIKSSNRCSLLNNTCNDNDNKGLWVVSSHGIVVTENTCEENYDGLFLIDSQGIEVTDNDCNFNSGNGIHTDSLRSSFINNTCNNNYDAGFYITGTQNVLLSNNTCKYNNRYGIWIYHTWLSEIRNNLIQENEQYGIYLDFLSNNNTIHHNILVDNYDESHSQAFDEGNFNTWYDSQTNEGNYWSDWKGIGFYEIDGSAESKDLYPLDEQGNPPVIEEVKIKIRTTIFTLIVLIPIIVIIKRKKKEV